MGLQKQDEGDEPDPRFTMANERTYLTWITTSMALSAGAVGVSALPESAFASMPRLLLSSVLIALATATGAAAYPRWRRIQRALRRNRPLPPPVLAPVLGYAVAAIAVLALIMIVWSVP